MGRDCILPHCTGLPLSMTKQHIFTDQIILAMIGQQWSGAGHYDTITSLHMETMGREKTACWNCKIKDPTPT